MKSYHIFILGICILAGYRAVAKDSDSSKVFFSNSAELLLRNKPGLGIGGYGEVHYNQPLNKGLFDAGTLDVHRVVLFVGYNFSKNTQFVTEIEVEYAKEVWIEQAFIQQKLFRFVNFRAGLLLIPMGIINEYHEPTTFNGVERPVIDNKICPTTWREVGMGFTGNIQPASLKYQLYVVNGFSGYDGTSALFSGSKALREGRQKGSKSYMFSPNFSGKIEYYGIPGLSLGLSGYAGKSQSRLFQGLNKDSAALIATADSSVVGITMAGLDARYTYKGLRLTGQFYYTAVSNTGDYNLFTGSNGKPNDLGRSMTGYYIEAGYNVFRLFPKIRQELMPFVRYEFYNTQLSMAGEADKNPANENTVVTAGVTFTIIRNVVLKSDMQFVRPAAADVFQKVFNAGIGVTF